MDARKIYWIGGSSCSGKSGCARRLAEANNWHLYSTDENAFGKYMFGLKTIDNFPAIRRYRDFLCSGPGPFVDRDAGTTADAFIAFCKEVFSLMLEEIRALAKDAPLVVEGAHCLPCLLGDFRSSSVFLIGSREQRKTVWLSEMEGKISGGHPQEIDDFNNPEYRESFVERRLGLHDRIADYIREDARSFGAKWIDVDTGVGLDAVYEKVSAALGLPAR